jgi:putative chitinase
MTPEQFKTITGNKEPEVWASLLNTNLPLHGITSKYQIAAFIAQCSHESGGFNIMVENLNYSSDGLRKVFPKYFPDTVIADKYARQPKAIGSRVYAGRMGNGSEASGDGYKFRGRGILQLTGKINYMECSASVYHDDRLMETPELLEGKEGALLSALWFWDKNKLKDVADFTVLTKRINGGTNGAADRVKYLQKAMSILD